MKKKMYLAVLALCIALTASACGNSTTTENTKTEAKTEQEDKKDTTEKKADKKTATRLVSVDNVDKYLTLGEYKGITVDNTVTVVTDDDVDAQIDSELLAAAEEVSDGAKNGDIVTINYVGTKDGEPFDGGTANNYDLTLGSGGMVPGFEEGIVGMKKGETKDVELTFPEEYYEGLAGEDVVFKMTCQKVRRKAELTEDWVTKNTEYKTIDEYRAGVKAKMEEDAKASAREALKSTAWQQVVEASEVKEYPQKDVDNAIAEFKKMTELYATQGGMDLEKFVEAQGMTMEQFDEQCKMYAESKVKQVLIIQAIMDAEGMTFEDAESMKIQDQLITESGSKDLAAMIDIYGQAAVDESIGLLRVETFILDNAEIHEVAASGDTVGENADAADDAADQTPDEENVLDKELEKELEGIAAVDDDTVDVTADAEESGDAE